MLFIRNIAPYKGLHLLLRSIKILKDTGFSLKLIIAGKIKSEKKYWDENEKYIKENSLEECIVREMGFVTDNRIELLFNAADVLLIPYINIYQSGVLFVSYCYGLPVIATNVGVSEKTL